VFKQEPVHYLGYSKECQSWGCVWHFVTCWIFTVRCFLLPAQPWDWRTATWIKQ
jgi:hypothetical protein